jgi:hypothetical protein
MGKKTRSRSGMNIPDHISESLETIFRVKKNLKYLMRIRIRNLFDPGSGKEKFGIRYKQTESATLVVGGFDIFPVTEPFPYVKN